MDGSTAHGPREDDFRRLLEPGAIRAVVQPIVRLGDLQPIGYEGLARFPTPPGLVALPPDVLLAAADRSGLRGDLEVACWAAISAAGAPPAGRLLFVNVAPDALGHPGLLALAERMPSRLVIELTEQDTVQNLAVIRRRLRPWIERGALVAVDDAGAGFTSLEYVAEIRPDFLKLCRALVTEVDRDQSRQAVLRATVAFAHEVGARVVAEGVERPEELEALRDAEVDYGQGWLFGRPGPAWPDAAPAAPAARARPIAAPPSGGGRLERDLAAATSSREACEAVVDHLARHGLLPAAFLEQGGRLRCQAVRGHWQVHDGLLPTAGLIGRAFRSGEPAIAQEAARDPDALPTVPSVVAKACVPLRVDGTIAGVVAVEAPTALDPAALTDVARSAGLLATRLEALGGVGAATPAQLVARAAARLAELDEAEGILREAAAAARELTGFESAMVALADGHGGLYAHHAEGRFAIAFNDLEPATLATFAGWAEVGSSSHTSGDAAGRGLPGHEPLRRAGVEALAVVPLTTAGERLGVLALADRRSRRLATDEIELLELLGLQAALGLRRVVVADGPRERVARDPLTGLRHSAAFHQAVAAGRAAGRAAALLRADVDGLDAINRDRGRAAGDDVLREVAGLLRDCAPRGGRAFRTGGDEFALLFDCTSLEEAEHVAWALRSQAPGRTSAALTVEVDWVTAPAAT